MVTAHKTPAKKKPAPKHVPAAKTTKKDAETQKRVHKLKGA